MFENRSISKHMFGNTVHFQANLEKIPPDAASVFKKSLKMNRVFKHLFENGPIFKHLFENGPYLAHPFFKLAIGPVFQTFTI